ncbi:MAG: peptidylprolyl isomerase [Pseudomonadota bacterium]
MTNYISRLIMVGALIASPALSQDATTADTVVAEVNGTVITFGHIVSLASRLPPEYNQVQPEILYNGILDQLIQQELLAAEIDGDSKSAKLAMENEVRSVLATEALAAIAEEATSEDLILAAYEAEVANFTPSPEFRASHILVETEEEAAEVVEELEAGANFADLARERSTGPSGPNGGDLGWFGPGAMVPTFDEAVQAMEAGAISQPVETQFGWHVINLVEVRETTPPTLEERFPALSDQLRGEAIEAYITQLEVDAEISRPEVEVDLLQIRNGELLK